MGSSELSSLAPRGTFFHVMRNDEPIPANFAALATKALVTAAFRLAGGCSGMTDDQRARVVPYFVEALRGFGGVAISGGTLSGDGKLMVTNVPAALAAVGPCIALGTLPRTAEMSLGEAGVIVSDAGDTIDRGQHAVAVVQQNASTVLGWDGDLEVYLEFMQNLRVDAGWTVAVIAFNGGGVTKKEIIGAINRQMPLIVVRGSGRAADEFATQYHGGEGSFNPEIILKAKSESLLVHFVDFSNPASLRAAAVAVGLMD